MSIFIIILAVPSYSKPEICENNSIGQDEENNNNNTEQINEKNQASAFNALCISGVVNDEICDSSSEPDNGSVSKSLQGPPEPQGPEVPKGDKDDKGGYGVSWNN